MSNKEKVYSWIDKNQEEVIELLQKLVREPSVNPYFDEDKQYMHEGQAQAALKEYLEEMGMETEYSYPDAKSWQNMKENRDIMRIILLKNVQICLRS